MTNINDKSRAELEAMLAEVQAALAAKDDEPDWEAWRPAAEKACEVFFSCDTDSDVEDMAHALQAALPLTPAEPGDDAMEALAELSSYLGMGYTDPSKTSAAQYDSRIREGIATIGRVYRERAATVVEECSKRPSTTWGEVKRAILDDPAMEPATLSRSARWPGEISLAMIKAGARAVSESGTAADWTHAMAISRTVLRAAQSYQTGETE